MKRAGFCLSAAVLLCERVAQQSENRWFKSSGNTRYPDLGLYSPPTVAKYMSPVYEVIVDGEFQELPTWVGLNPESMNPIIILGRSEGRCHHGDSIPAIIRYAHTFRHL